MTQAKEFRDWQGHIVPQSWQDTISEYQDEGGNDPQLVITKQYMIPNTDIGYRLVLAQEGNQSNLKPGVYAMVKYFGKLLF